MFGEISLPCKEIIVQARSQLDVEFEKKDIKRYLWSVALVDRALAFHLSIPGLIHCVDIWDGYGCKVGQSGSFRIASYLYQYV